MILINKTVSFAQNLTMSVIAFLWDAPFFMGNE